MVSCDIHVIHFSSFLLLNWLLLVYIHTYIYVYIDTYLLYLVYSIYRVQNMEI